MPKLTVLFIASLMLCLNAQAAFIDQGTYFTDTSTKTDWLKLSVTMGKSYGQVESLINGGSLAGWRFATGYEFEQLMRNFGAVAGAGCNNGRRFCGEAAQYVEPTKQFIGLEGADALSGLLADPTSPGNSHWYSLVINLYKMTYSFPGTALIDTHHSKLGVNAAKSDVGSYLIRPATVSEVPLPNTLVLTLSSLGILVQARIRKASR